jgi:hypothetical protein
MYCTVYTYCDCRELSKNLLIKYQCMPTKQLLLARTPPTFVVRLKNTKHFLSSSIQCQVYNIRFVRSIFPRVVGLSSKTFVWASILSYSLEMLSAEHTILEDFLFSSFPVPPGISWLEKECCMGMHLSQQG